MKNKIVVIEDNGYLRRIVGEYTNEEIDKLIKRWKKKGTKIIDNRLQRII